MLLSMYSYYSGLPSSSSPSSSEIHRQSPQCSSHSQAELPWQSPLSLLDLMSTPTTPTQVPMSLSEIGSTTP